MEVAESILLSFINQPFPGNQRADYILKQPEFRRLNVYFTTTPRNCRCG